MKREDTSIKCPKCKHVQGEHLYDLVEAGDMEGQFEHDCSKCHETFLIKFEFRPFIEEVDAE